MAFSTGSFLAGVGTVFAAVTIGFAGGAIISTSPRLEQNRVERVAGNLAATPTKTATGTIATPAAERAESTAAPDRVIAMVASPTPQQQVPQQDQPLAAKDERFSLVDNAKNVRESELKKAAELKKAERLNQRHERRKQQETQAAATVMAQMRHSIGDAREASQREDTQRFGFFGND